MIKNKTERVKQKQNKRKKKDKIKQITTYII